MEDRCLSVEAISVCLGITKDTDYPWPCEKNLPALSVGKLWKFKKEDVDMCGLKTKQILKKDDSGILKRIISQ